MIYKLKLNQKLQKIATLDMEVSSILESTRWDSNVGGSSFHLQYSRYFDALRLKYHISSNVSLTVLSIMYHAVHQCRAANNVPRTCCSGFP